MICAVFNSRDRAATLARLRAVEPWAVDNSTAEDMAEGCALLDFYEAGRPVGAAAVLIEGERATITAAAFEGQKTVEHFARLEDMLRQSGVRHIVAHTRRPGVVRKLMRARGFDLAEAIMQKAI